MWQIRFFYWSFLLLCSIGLQAQAPFSLSTDLAFSNDLDEQTEEITAHIEVQNATDKTLVIIWERKVNALPSGWESYVCSDIVCAPPDQAQGIFSLEAGQNTNLDCHFSPNERGGQGEVQLLLYLREDSTQQLLANYQADNGLVSVQEPTEVPITVFPNPCPGDHVTISSKNKFEYVQICDILGHVWVEEQGTDLHSSLSIGHLPPGLYLLYTFRPDGRRQKAILLQKL
ncbi:MAG: T9SS type A sorting domain-containing protein [Bacteroidota bacterium]